MIVYLTQSLKYSINIISFLHLHELCFHFFFHFVVIPHVDGQLIRT